MFLGNRGKETRRLEAADGLVALLFEQPIGLPRPGEVDGRSYTVAPDEPRSEFEDLAFELTARLRRYHATHEDPDDDLGGAAVQWLRHIMDVLDLVVVVKGPDPESWSILPAAEAVCSAPSRGGQSTSGGTSTIAPPGSRTRSSKSGANAHLRLRFTLPSLGS